MHMIYHVWIPADHRYLLHRMVMVVTALMMFLIGNTQPGLAQNTEESDDVPPGQPQSNPVTVTTTTLGGNLDLDITHDDHSIHWDSDIDLPLTDFSGSKVIDKIQKIACVFPKKGSESKIIVLLTNGEYYVLDFIDLPPTVVEHSNVGGSGYGYFSTGDGDALYFVSSPSVYVSRDSGATYQLDTAGLGYAYVWNIAVDSAQFVWAVTTNGLYVQHPDSNVWHQDTSYKGPVSLYSIYIDRMNRKFVATNGSGLLFMSTNTGSPWLIDTAGAGSALTSVAALDRYGNLYALGFIGNASALFKSAGGSAPWTRIDQNLQATAGPGVNINGVAADSGIVAATSFGNFLSSDQGATWIDGNAHIKASTFSGYLKTRDGTVLISTALGVYKKGPSDTVWTKILPVNNYQGNISLYADGAKIRWPCFPLMVIPTHTD